jgi:hypothetical protein
MSYSYLSSEPYDFTSHITGHLTGERHKIPRVYRDPYGLTGKMTPGGALPHSGALSDRNCLFLSSGPKPDP